MTAPLTFGDLVRLERPCDEAVAWAASRPDRTLVSLRASCPRGDWMLWLARVAGVDTRAVGYWCAERARQSAIRALDAAGVPSAALRACAPVADRGTAWAARTAARAASEAAWAASWAAEAAEAAAAEHQAIADHVRATIPWSTVEAGLRARLAAL